ncbi:unnamed protein product [Vitrella brassicaformis CCMP3155]|uniref:TLDc domain-containing protein n=1 Tax=Vitrella brassicaformis (strain CCMP3155) TaxID=1169540 RepID=A0A0G4EY86_VITBC|nr:unnamed protein product [Vitrella brassicaformis CCMP3155]|eukprot:CEM03594.1 unnamed protein product [Vitrella brassicaformis CCMP3155]
MVTVREITMLLAFSLTLVLTLTPFVACRPQVRRVQAVDRVPVGSSLSQSEYDDLRRLLVNETRVESVYRSSVHGSSYSNMLRRVNTKDGLVFLIRKDDYVFGAFVGTGLYLPAVPEDYRVYWSGETWHFSLAGHFSNATKIPVDERRRYIEVAGRKASGVGANVVVGGRLWLGYGGLDRPSGQDRPAADIRRCLQYITKDRVPAGYVGVRDAYGDGVFGGNGTFVADELEVLHVVRYEIELMSVAGVEQVNMP